MVKFGMRTRRHHCRSCGFCVCNTCSPCNIAVTGYEDPQRTCVNCAKKWLQNVQQQWNTLKKTCNKTRRGYESVKSEKQRQLDELFQRELFEMRKAYEKKVEEATAKHKERRLQEVNDIGAEADKELRPMLENLLEIEDEMKVIASQIGVRMRSNSHMASPSRNRSHLLSAPMVQKTNKVQSSLNRDMINVNRNGTAIET